VRILEAEGYIGAEEAERYRRMVAFRNRVVQLYNRIDAGVVQAILRDHAGDIESFRERLLDVIARHPDP
jgi:uncharacterized protein YutE (UPF0331/DUF86 family)